MGQLLSLFSKSKVVDIYVDIENAKPSEVELKTHNRVQSFIDSCERITKVITEFKGCHDLCKDAISNPSEQSERAAFEGLLGSIDVISEIRQHSNALGDAVKLLLEHLSGGDAKQTLEDQQALVKQLAIILGHMYDFDQLRMGCSQLSNDFSFYKRFLPKFKKHAGVKITSEHTSELGIFISKPFPMISSVSEATKTCLKKVRVMLLPSFSL
jgi:hypothetical protein